MQCRGRIRFQYGEHRFSDGGLAITIASGDPQAPWWLPVVLEAVGSSDLMDGQDGIGGSCAKYFLPV